MNFCLGNDPKPAAAVEAPIIPYGGGIVGFDTCHSAENEFILLPEGLSALLSRQSGAFTFGLQHPISA